MKSHKKCFHSAGDGGGSALQPTEPPQNSSPTEPPATPTEGVGEAEPSDEEGKQALKYSEQDMQALQETFEKRLQESTEQAVSKALGKLNMTAEELAQVEETERLQALEKREQEVTRRELKAETGVLLAEKQIPNEFIDILMGTDLETTKQRVDSFKKQFDQAVHKQVITQLAGTTPKTGNISPKPDDPFLTGFNGR